VGSKATGWVSFAKGGRFFRNKGVFFTTRTHSFANRWVLKQPDGFPLQRVAVSLETKAFYLQPELIPLQTGGF
jgi:hypothetical protein